MEKLQKEGYLTERPKARIEVGGLAADPQTALYGRVFIGRDIDSSVPTCYLSFPDLKKIDASILLDSFKQLLEFAGFSVEIILPADNTELKN